MKSRLLGLDVFRGLTIILMILVNSLDSRVTLPYIQHVKWNGCSLADMVFPFFLIMVGISIVLKYAKSKANANWEIGKRSLWLFGIGVALNAFPHILSHEHLRIMGVLQRIAICYGLSAICCLHASIKQQTGAIVFILVTYWMLSSYWPTTYLSHFNHDCGHNLLGCVDRWVFSSQHLYQANFDPEGLLSTYPALASCLIGNLIGYALADNLDKTRLQFGLLITGVGLCLLGYYWGKVYPINKSLWSSTYVLWTAGWAILVLVVCFFLAKFACFDFLTATLALFGQHSLLIYVLHVLGLKLQYLKYFGASGNAYNMIHQALQRFFVPSTAAMVYSLLYLGICYLILRCRSFVK